MRIMLELPAYFDGVTESRVSEVTHGILAGLSLLAKDVQQHVEWIGIQVDGHPHDTIVVTIKMTKEARFRIDQTNRCKSVVFEVEHAFTDLFDSVKKQVYSKTSVLSNEIDALATTA